MITREHPTAEGNTHTVTFRAPAEMDGEAASVVGDFNGWDPAANPFSTFESEQVATVHLPPGRYRFRYLSASGRWFNDPQADAYEDNEHGGCDGVLDLAQSRSTEDAGEPGGRAAS